MRNGSGGCVSAAKNSGEAISYEISATASGIKLIEMANSGNASGSGEEMKRKRRRKENLKWREEAVAAEKVNRHICRRQLQKRQIGWRRKKSGENRKSAGSGAVIQKNQLGETRLRKSSSGSQKRQPG